MPPKLNRRRAVLGLTRIDEILAWQDRTDQERDRHFVDLGRYLCEVRAGQYWRIDNLKSFDEFLEKKFPKPGARPTPRRPTPGPLPRVPKAAWQKSAGRRPQSWPRSRAGM